MGTSYAHLVKAYLNNREPGKYTFTNRGVGGNRVVDMYARIKADLINLRPDLRRGIKDCKRMVRRIRSEINS